MWRSNPRARRLEEVPLLSGIGRVGLDSVARRGDLLPVREGSVVVRPHDLTRHFYLLVSGQAELRSDQGKVQLLQAGDSYGAVQILSRGDEKAHPEIGMISDGELLIIGRREFTALLDTVPRFTRRLAEDFARQLQKTA